MSITAIFIVGVFEFVLLMLFVYITVHEIRKL